MGLIGDIMERAFLVAISKLRSNLGEVRHLFFFFFFGGGGTNVFLKLTIDLLSSYNSTGRLETRLPNTAGGFCHNLYTDFFFIFLFVLFKNIGKRSERAGRSAGYSLALAVNKSPAVYILSRAFNGL